MTARRAYPRKVEIARAVEAARELGIVVGTVEIGADGTIRIISAPAGGIPMDNPYDRWKAGRQGG